MANLSATYAAVVGAIERNKNLRGEQKWGKMTYAIDGDFHHWICAVGLTKKSVNLSFHFGGLLEDKKKMLIAGSSLFLRKIEYASPAEVDAGVISGFVNQAIGKLQFFKDNWKRINKEKRVGYLNNQH